MSMPVAYRVDSGVELGRPRRTPQGFLRVDGFAARPGVYRYADPSYPGGVRLELRPRSEVFSPKSLASYEGAPITDGHPPKGVGEVNSANVRELKVGTVMGSGFRADDAVAVPLLFEDKSTVGKVERREKTQLSPGYRIDLELSPGVDPEFGPYHVIQRNIRVNHVALVGGARGGGRMQVRLDEADECVGVLVTSAAPRRGAITMDQEEQIRLLKSQLADAERLAAQRQDAADEATARADNAEARVEPLKARILELETQIANGATEVETSAIARERLRADEAEEAVRRFDERFEEGVKRRANLMRRASEVLGDEFRMDDLSERQIHAAVIKRLNPSADVKNPTDAFLAGTFETLLEIHKKTARSLTRVSSSFVRQDQEDTQGDDKAKRLKDFRDQWKKPLPNDIRARRGERA